MFIRRADLPQSWYWLFKSTSWKFKSKHIIYVSFIGLFFFTQKNSNDIYSLQFLRRVYCLFWKCFFNHLSRLLTVISILHCATCRPTEDLIFQSFSRQSIPNLTGVLTLPGLSMLPNLPTLPVVSSLPNLGGLAAPSSAPSSSALLYPQSVLTAPPYTPPTGTFTPPTGTYAPSTTGTYTPSTTGTYSSPVQIYMLPTETYTSTAPAQNDSPPAYTPPTPAYTPTAPAYTPPVPAYSTPAPTPVYMSLIPVYMPSST